MNNQYKPLPTPKPIEGAVNNPMSVSQYTHIEGAATTATNAPNQAIDNSVLPPIKTS